MAYKETGDSMLPDPCDCSAFYKCQRLSDQQTTSTNVEEDYLAIRMVCPKCTEWDQGSVSCSIIPDPKCVDTTQVYANATS